MNLRKKRCAIILAMVVVASILVPLQAEAASWRKTGTDGGGRKTMVAGLPVNGVISMELVCF